MFNNNNKLITITKWCGFTVFRDRSQFDSFNFRPAAQIVVQAERWCPCEREKVRNQFRFDSIRKISLKKTALWSFVFEKTKTKQNKTHTH